MDDYRLLTLADGRGALLTSDGRLFEIADIGVLRLGPGDALLVRVGGSALQAAHVERIKAVLGHVLGIGPDRIVVASPDMSFEILCQDGAEEGKFNG